MLTASIDRLRFRMAIILKQILIVHYLKNTSFNFSFILLVKLYDITYVSKIIKVISFKIVICSNYKLLYIIIFPII